MTGTSEELEQPRLARLRAVLELLAERNAFYGPRLRAAGLSASLTGFDEFVARMPFTTKQELALDQRAHPPYGSNLTYPRERYSRLHETSSTTGEPLRWLDTAEDWSWMVRGWQHVLDGAGATEADRVLFAFSFGPFIGFWLGWDAAERMGCLCISGATLDSLGRLRLLRRHEATILCCTPTYALRLGEVASAEGVDVGSVRAVIVAGEPGGSLAATRSRLESLWGGAQVYDHYGMTEVGPVTYQCPDSPDTVHVVDEHYFCEVVDPDTGAPLAPETPELGELVLTTLGRGGAPLLRYRTGDLVRRLAPGPCACGRVTTRFQGGIVARADQMTVVRGVNLYPSAFEEVLRRHDEVAEYRVEISTRASMREVTLFVELHPGHAERTVEAQLSQSLRAAFHLRIPISFVPVGTLPRFELKARRWSVA